MIDNEEFRERFWKALDDSPFVMLALVDKDEAHSQPMTAQIDPDFHGKLHFFTSSENAFARGGDAVISYSSKGHDLFASVHGRISVDNDPAKIDKLWSSIVAAWYEEGRDDPKLTLLRMDLGRAQIWEAGTGSFLKEMVSLLFNDTANEEAMKHQTKTSFAA